MTRLLRALVAAGLVLALPSVVLAQAKKGDKEVLVAGHIMAFTTSFDGESSTFTTGTATAGLGFFMSDRLQLGIAPSLTISRGGFGGDGESSTDFQLGVAARANYFFGQSDAKVKPYVGYEFNISDLSAPEGGSIADNIFNAGVVGVKNYLSERAALDFNASYGFGIKNPGAFQMFTLRVGISYLF